MTFFKETWTGSERSQKSNLSIQRSENSNQSQSEEFFAEQTIGSIPEKEKQKRQADIFKHLKTFLNEKMGNKMKETLKKKRKNEKEKVFTFQNATKMEEEIREKPESLEFILQCIENGSLEDYLNLKSKKCEFCQSRIEMLKCGMKQFELMLKIEKNKGLFYLITIKIP